MISVIIPTFNAEKYIGEALESIYTQTYKGETEIIVIDDGSSDRTAEIVNKFPKIKYFYQNNSGQSAASNRGLSISKGNFITWLDHDDWFEKEKLEKQHSFLMDHSNIDFVYSDFKVYDEMLEKYYTQAAEPYIDPPENFLATILFRQIMPSFSCSMMKRRCITKKCFWSEDITFGADYIFCLRLLMNGFKPGYIPLPLYGYRRHPNNLSNNHAQNKQGEIDLIKALGLETIERIVEKSLFSPKTKGLLLARILLKIGHPIRSLKFLDIEKQCNKSSSLYQFYAGNCHFLLRDYEKASTHYKDALKSEGENKIRAEILNNLACTLTVKGKVDDAKGFFLEASKLRPGYMDPELNYQKCKFPISHEELHLTSFELRNQLQNYV